MIGYLEIINGKKYLIEMSNVENSEIAYIMGRLQDLDKTLTELRTRLQERGERVELAKGVFWDQVSGVISRGNQALGKLTKTENSVFSLLIRHRGRVITHRDLVHGAWGHEYVGDVDRHKVNLNVSRINIKMRGLELPTIMSFDGIGYGYGLVASDEERDRVD